MSVISDFEKRTGLVVQVKVGICETCKDLSEGLFAPFGGDYGHKAVYCSDCQMEAENEIAEQEEFSVLGEDY